MTGMVAALSGTIGVSAAAGGGGGGGGGPTGSINITDRSVTRYSVGFSASAEYTIANDGVVRNHNGTSLETWNTNPGSVGSYEVRATLTGGDPVVAGAALGTWLGCGTSRSWSITANPGESYISYLNVEVRLASSGAVQDSAAITLVAQSEA